MDNFATTNDMLPLVCSPDPILIAEQEDRRRTPPGVPVLAVEVEDDDEDQP